MKLYAAPRSGLALGLIAAAACALTAAIPAFAAPAGRTVIGIAKFVSHPALDALEKGIMDEMKAARPDLIFDVQNSNGDMGTAAQIAQRFHSENVAIAIGIATPTAQALANAIHDRPVIFSAVTDPVAAGLVASAAKGAPNVTGTSDMTPVRQQLELLISLKKIKRLGHIYNAGEANSVRLAQLVASFCKEKGIQVVTATVANSSEVKQAALSIADRIDGIYLGNDNTVFSALSAVCDVANSKKIPVVTADPSSAEEGMPVLAALGFDYYAMGRTTGKMALRVLAGEKTQNIPTYFSTDPADMMLVVNKDTAVKIGLSLSEAVLGKAAVIIEAGRAKRR